MPYDFFISHSSRLDTEADRFIRAVAAGLKRRGCAVFLDSESLEEGMPLGPSIRAAIAESQVGVIMYSRASAESPWVEYEVCQMFKQKVKQSLRIWVLCLPPSGDVPAWAEPKEVLAADDCLDPEHAAEVLFRRYLGLDG